MKIIFQKKKDACFIKIIRDDETSTWSKTNEIGVLHDLCHFVVEKNLKYTEAFYGLINQGFAIHDFEKPRAERAVEILPVNLPLQAMQTEYIAGLLQISVFDETIRKDFLEILKGNFDAHHVIFPEELSLDKVNQIQEEIDQLYSTWKASEEGLELSF